MLARRFRVRKEEFDSIIKKGGYYQSPFFTVRYLPTTEKTNFAVVVSKIVSNSAVVRNKTKRRVWDLISRNQGIFKDGFNIVFFTKKNIDKEGYERLEKNFIELIKKSRLVA